MLCTVFSDFIALVFLKTHATLSLAFRPSATHTVPHHSADERADQRLLREDRRAEAALGSYHQACWLRWAICGSSDVPEVLVRVEADPRRLHVEQKRRPGGIRCARQGEHV